MLGLLGVDAPQRQSRELVVRRDPQRLLQRRDLRRGILGNDPLHILLEGGERRMPALHLRRRHGRIRQQAARDTRMDGEEVVERSALGDLRKHAAGVEANRPHPDGELIAFDLEAANDHLRRTDDLADADERRVAERRNSGDAQLLERADAILTRQRASASPNAIVIAQRAGDG